MEKKGVILLTLVIVFLTVIAIANAVDLSNSKSGAGTTVIATGTLNESAAGTNPAQGGNVSLMNLNASASTVKWQGYYGNVSANISLGNGTNTLFNFGSANKTTQIRSVFATLNSSFSFANAAIAAVADIDAAWNFNTSDIDSTTLSFANDTATISTITSVPVINLTAYQSMTGGCNSSKTQFFKSGIFKDSTAPAIFFGYYGYFAFGVTVNASKCAFDNTSYVDYELIVPVNSTSLTQTYQFYLDII